MFFAVGGESGRKCQTDEQRGKHGDPSGDTHEESPFRLKASSSYLHRRDTSPAAGWSLRGSKSKFQESRVPVNRKPHFSRKEDDSGTLLLDEAAPLGPAHDRMELDPEVRHSHDERVEENASAEPGHLVVVREKRETARRPGENRATRRGRRGRGFRSAHCRPRRRNPARGPTRPDRGRNARTQDPRHACRARRGPRAPPGRVDRRSTPRRRPGDRASASEAGKARDRTRPPSLHEPDRTPRPRSPRAPGATGPSRRSASRASP